jgi:hypothetical protein
MEAFHFKSASSTGLIPIQSFDFHREEPGDARSSK